MSSIRVSPAEISGKASPPPSKSAAHRALICAALAGGGSVDGVIQSDDMRATMNGIRALGINEVWEGNTVKILGQQAPPQNPVVDCLESGSTLRFLIPIFAALGIDATFTGCGRLPQRPLGVYADCLPEHGVAISTKNGLPLTINGRLQAGKYHIPGDISSQFITGLLFALPLCGGDSEIILTTPLESAPYIDLTIDILKQAGIQVFPFDGGYRIPGGQRFKVHDYKVEGDWSQAAFLLALGALGGEIALTGIGLNSRQGDREIVDIMMSFGADIKSENGVIYCRRSALTGTEIDAAQIPDLVPIIAVLASTARGVTTITGAARLRLKESDRLAAISTCINLLGGKAEGTSDGLRIYGAERLKGGVTVPSFGDHRIVMSMAAAALACEEPVIIENYQAVSKSWPGFFEVYKACGGAANVI
ncbi:MAG TPA: 3-phosphoshikimate 1-carboxyvinyltransferase [Clostridiales bacterium]|nr:3-phosphoshikimate 1-carboxyvinyltransferase [Clostridiales bacterium]